MIQLRWQESSTMPRQRQKQMCIRSPHDKQEELEFEKDRSQTSKMFLEPKAKPLITSTTNLRS
jgi:hypothetical protein